jgi:hypothetical protein
MSRLAVLRMWLLLSALPGCFQQNFGPRVACSQQSDCVKVMGVVLADGAASLGELPDCCSGVCVLPAGGCEWGSRYLTFDPNNAPYVGYGDCTMDVYCSPPPPDMSIPDLAQVPDMAYCAICGATCPECVSHD